MSDGQEIDVLSILKATNQLDPNPSLGIAIKEIERLRAELDEVEEDRAHWLCEIQKKDKPCEWRVDDDMGVYSTQCGEMFWLDSGDLAENDFRFCCYCGHPAKEVSDE